MDILYTITSNKQVMSGGMVDEVFPRLCALCGRWASLMSTSAGNPVGLSVRAKHVTMHGLARSLVCFWSLATHPTSQHSQMKTKIRSILETLLFDQRQIEMGMCFSDFANRDLLLTSNLQDFALLPTYKCG